VHWFSFYGLRDYLRALGLRCFDRFDMIDETRVGSGTRLVLRGIRSVPPLRWLGQVATPYTVVFAIKG
jgi:hypothetical protein